MGTLLWWTYQSPAAHSCSLLNHPNSFCREMFKPSAKFDADVLLYCFSNCERKGPTLHKLTQWCLIPPLTSTVKSSSFPHTHSSPLPLASRFHQCHTKVHVILTMAGLCQDRPHMCVCMHACTHMNAEPGLCSWTYLQSITI